MFGRPHRGRRGTQSRSASLLNPSVGSSEPPEFFGHRLQTSMTPATVEDSTAGLGQTLRTGHPLVGGLCLHGVCTSSLAPRPPGGLQVLGHEEDADTGLGSLALGSDSWL